MKIFSGKLSAKYLEERNIKFEKTESNINKDKAEEMICDEMPDILITGTGGGNIEQELRNIAYERNIKSVVVLDFWKDYSRRWLYATYPVEAMKDKVCVMDELTKEEMIKENFPEKNLIVTGHPYLDLIFNYERNDMIENNDKFNDKNRVNEQGRKHSYLFLSQPLKIIGVTDYEEHPLKILLEALKCTGKEKVSLTIKLHPIENKSDELISLADSYNSDELEIKFADEKSSLKNLISESGAVIGYNTIAMFEARAFSKRTISLNVVPVKKSLTAAMKKAGIEIIDANVSSVLECLNKNDEKTDNEMKDLFRGGIENCLKVILDEVHLN